ncbi:nuclear transport factor 2 family protein [Streptomyces sp. T7(2022)]|uniref:nuclear transport factor 2 family protein n=1 Tax=Streptomyces sp. T7(2022) TaxID=2916034 RepID=UPI0027E22E58|nr:nuclear transport factor 2 family protein [Streptomyces sp. T7(2022)]
MQDQQRPSTCRTPSGATSGRTPRATSPGPPPPSPRTPPSPTTAGPTRGVSAITDWLGRTSTEYTYTATLVGAEREGDDRCTVHQHLEGDFPGGTVDLHYRFPLDQGLISRLDIAP